MYVCIYVCLYGRSAGTLFFHERSGGMGVMKTERYLATEKCDHCFRTRSLGTAATERRSRYLAEQQKTPTVMKTVSFRSTD